MTEEGPDSPVTAASSTRGALRAMEALLFDHPGIPVAWRSAYLVECGAALLRASWIHRSAEKIDEDLDATVTTIVRWAATLPDVLDAELVHILAQARAGVLDDAATEAGQWITRVLEEVRGIGGPNDRRFQHVIGVGVQLAVQRPLPPGAHYHRWFVRQWNAVGSERRARTSGPSALRRNRISGCYDK